MLQGNYLSKLNDELNQTATQFEILDPPNYILRKYYELYHYTNLEGIKGILAPSFEKNVFVLKHKNVKEFSGNNKEGNDFNEKFKETLNYFKENNMLSLDKYDCLLNLLENFENRYYLTVDVEPNITNIVVEKCNVYIASFCAEKSLYMQHKYAHGSNIECFFAVSSVDLMEETKQYLGKFYKHLLREVIYKDEEKYRLLFNFFKIVSKKDRIVSFSSLFIGTYKYLFKPKDLSYEKEIRSIYIKSKNDYNEPTLFVPFTDQTIFGYGYTINRDDSLINQIDYLSKRYKKIIL